MPMIHPEFNPIALSIGPVALRWYGLMYLLAFVLFVMVCRIQIQRQYRSAHGMSKDSVDDLLFWGAIGVILGGRLGYVLFYKFSYYLAHPSEIWAVWEGGMSFHGGFIGVVVALTLWAKRHQVPWLQLGDFVAPAIPLGLAAGRLGNFINGELWGRQTDPSAWWAMVFPQANDGLARHPSQLYQFALEGLTLFALTWWFASKPRPAGAVVGLFIGGYGVCRFVAEFAREPDLHLGLLGLGLSMGQWLSMPMLAVGSALMWLAYRNQPQLTQPTQSKGAK
jgi:phosphatidylglycerol---prolipoprotein diacylglyceryl transferase